MTIPVVAAALLFWVAVFMIYFASLGMTPVEFFLGRFEAPPHHLGTWRPLGIDPVSGLVREERVLLPDSGARSSYLLLQVRFREPATGKIVAREPERRLARSRIRARARG